MALVLLFALIISAFHIVVCEEQSFVESSAWDVSKALLLQFQCNSEILLVIARRLAISNKLDSYSLFVQRLRPFHRRRYPTCLVG